MEILLLFGVFFVLLVLGVPVAVAMMAASIVDIVVMGIPWILAPERMINSINSFPLLAIPFFIFAGVVMNQGGLTRRLVDVSRAFVGHFRGGTAQMNVMASILFSGVSGSSAADAAAIGSILIPAMKKEGYDPGFSVGVTAASSCIGPIIPPSIIMVIYGSMTNLSIGALFLAGILPGIAIGVVQMALVAFYSVRRNYPHRSRLAWKARWRTVWVALPALGAPVIIIGGIVSGFYTPTEAGVIASVYGLFVGLVLYRELRLRDLPMVLVQAVELTAVPVLVLAAYRARLRSPGHRGARCHRSFQHGPAGTDRGHAPLRRVGAGRHGGADHLRAGADAACAGVRLRRDPFRSYHHHHHHDRHGDAAGGPDALYRGVHRADADLRRDDLAVRHRHAGGGVGNHHLSTLRYGHTGGAVGALARLRQLTMCFGDFRE